MLVFLLSTVSSLIHDMIYSLICSRTSKGLSLGELIHAFCIIILASYRTISYGYSHCLSIIHAFLDDFRDFSTKSPSLVFNSWEAENLIFRILFVSGLSGSLKIKAKIPDQFFTWRSTLSQRSTRGGGGLQGSKETRWRALPQVPLYKDASVSPKNLSHIFPEIY